MLKKYFALTTATGDLRLIFIGKFYCIGEAIEHGDKYLKDIIWYLTEDDFQTIVADFERTTEMLKAFRK